MSGFVIMYKKNFQKWKKPVMIKIEENSHKTYVRSGEIRWTVLGVNIGSEIDGKEKLKNFIGYNFYMKIFVTGISGTGKTTIANKLKDKDFNIIDIDYVPNLCAWVNLKTGEKSMLRNTESPNNKFIDEHDYICDTKQLQEMMKDKETVFVFGSVGDNSSLLHLFDKTILLQCKPETLVERLKNRDTNDMGKKEEVQQRMLEWKKVFDALMIESGAIVVDTEKPVEKVVDEIIKIFKSG
jgi:dephospho-CoA kinase